ncbi:AAA family ATPase [Pseudomonas juntendi]|nr:AAA family ATPase [Pseudomonas juntendi]
MLIEFSVTNFKSIRERQTLSMVASNYYKELVDENTFEVESEESFPRLLKSAVIYGPNASGKSTLVEAMEFVDNFVCTSSNESQAGDLVAVVPFKLSAETRKGDSQFDVAFFEEGVRYEFGFCANSERVTAEWLYAYPKGRAQRMYTRYYNDDAVSYHYVWGRISSEGDGVLTGKIVLDKMLCFCRPLYSSIASSCSRRSTGLKVVSPRLIRVFFLLVIQ